MNGCPYIMYDADYYQELNPTADFFTENSTAVNLGWGRGIKFGTYRRALLNHENIYDTIDSTPYYCWIDT